MKPIMTLTVATLGVLWVLAFPQSGAKPNNPPVSGADRTFAVSAAADHMAEVQLGDLAQERGAGAFVREFGAMMAKEHGAALAELKSLAADKRIALPTALTASHQATYGKLDKLVGTTFDQAYKTAMLRDHERGIKKVTAYLRAAKDPQLRAYAEGALETKRRHLQILKAGKMPQGH